MTLLLYFANEAPTYTPPTRRAAAGWNKTSGSVTRKLGPRGTSGTNASVVNGKTVSTTNYDILHGVWTSEPITRTMTIPTTDTLGLTMGRQPSTGSTFNSVLCAYFTVGSTDTVRATWRDAVGTSFWGTASGNAGWTAGSPGASMAVQAGDRLVIEVGVRDTTSATDRTATMWYGNGGGADFPTAATSGTPVTTDLGYVYLAGDSELLWTPTPGSVFDIDDWKITLPTGPASDATEVTQPTLETYADANFRLDGSNRMVMTAPVQGSTTSGSGGTRCELREMESGSEASWALATSGARQLTVSGIFDPTNITDRKEMIVGQIHGTTGSPPIYLAVEHHVATPRLRIYKDGPGLANILTGLTSTTEITYRLRVESGRVKLWAAIGGVAALPAIPQYDWAAAEFTDNTGCYFKAGSYNKSEVADLGTGSAIATITYWQLLQPGDTIPPLYPEPGRFLVAC